ncbi:uncharacterized protein B0P05DRAFT_560109 [Gilbertella persicaria]|uniref:uncharacterized protein n=1 Tax=Gilbertella persicaria TaxID=101096 RepID=UPI00221FCD41|nr:uncharacterized protein B0P05DRAFT_560109 [Gilbertella persicaria]KAI8056546.1 hypothetical protein B0P05DRAFT_560109 [Gilbertella persicaria]
MLLDWKRFEDTIEFDKDKHDKHEYLVKIIQSSGFLNTFLTQLLEELKSHETATQCVERYPNVGIILTRASTHPFIAYHITNAELLISCLIEYSKLNLAFLNEGLDLNASKNKSIKWCIIRLRRLVSAAHTTEDDSRLFRRIEELLEAKKNNLDSQLLSRLADKCIALLYEEKATIILEKLLSCILNKTEKKDPLHFDPSESILSNEFITSLSHLMVDRSPNNQFLQWPDDLKIRLLLNYKELLTIQVLEFAIVFIEQQNNYENLDILCTKLQQNGLLKLIRSSVDLTIAFVDTFSAYVVRFSNWKLVRISQCIHRILRYPFLNLKSITMPSERHQHLINYIYNGSIESILDRRNVAWCFALSPTHFLWHCVYTLIQWCQQKEPWCLEMESILVHVNWVIYPSLDSRESQSLYDLKSWIQSSQGNDGILIYLPKMWHSILNSNLLILACFVTSIFFSTSSLHVEQQLSLVEHILTSSDQSKHEIPKT